MSKENSSGSSASNSNKRYNTKKYRIDKKEAFGESLVPDKYFFMKNNSDYTFNLISRPEASQSMSVVVHLRHNTKKTNYVMKINLMKERKVTPGSYPETEAKFYKLMELLVKKNITPHVFILTAKLDAPVAFDDMDKQMRSELSFFRDEQTPIHSVFPMVIETNRKGLEMVTLGNLLGDMNSRFNGYRSSKDARNGSFILFNLLFQIFYTLLCFEEIDLKHNDLHFSNIFVIKAKKNILDEPGSLPKKYRKYAFKKNSKDVKIIKLPYIGLDVRIYDFDRSVKQANSFPFYREKIVASQLPKDDRTGQSSRPNKDLDKYKVLATLLRNYNYRKNYSLPLSVVKFIEKCFKNNILLYVNGKLHGKSVDLIHNNHNYNLLTRQLPKGTMMTNTEIVKLLGKKVKSSRHSSYTLKKREPFDKIETYATPSVGDLPADTPKKEPRTKRRLFGRSKKKVKKLEGLTGKITQV